MALVATSFFAHAGEEIFIASAKEWAYFLPGKGINPVRRNADGTLHATVVAKGKGSKYGEVAILSVDVNCKTGQINQQNSGWEVPKAGTIKEAEVVTICGLY